MYMRVLCKLQITTQYQFQLFPFWGSWFALFLAWGSLSLFFFLSLSFFLFLLEALTQILADSGSQNTQGQGITNHWGQEWKSIELVNQDTELELIVTLNSVASPLVHWRSQHSHPLCAGKIVHRIPIMAHCFPIINTLHHYLSEISAGLCLLWVKFFNN